MKIILRITTIILLAVLSFGLQSCRKEKVKRIGVSQCTTDPWRDRINAEMERAVLSYPEISMEIRTANDSVSRQIEDIKYFTDNDFDAIIISPTSKTEIVPAVEAAYKKGIPIVMLDPTINGDSYTTRLLSDSYDIGHRAAECIINDMGTTHPIRPIEIKGLEGTRPVTERHGGFIETMQAHGISVLADGNTDWSEAGGQRVTDSLLRLYPEANAIFAHNDYIAIGARNAANALGRKDIYIVGVDADPNVGMIAVRDGVLNATILNPTAGYEIVETAVKLVNGEKVAMELHMTTPSPVDKSNVEALLAQNHSLEKEAELIRGLKSSLDKYWAMYSAQTTLFYSSLIILLLLLGLVFVTARWARAKRRHASELEQKNKELEEAVKSKLAFYTSVSHDLRTPLTLLAEPISELARAQNLTPRQRTMARLADKNVHILMNLINQILDFRKYEDGKLNLNLECLDFSREVEAWAGSFRDLAQQRHIHFEVKSPDDKCGNMHVMLDREKMERIFFNLLSNALKFTGAEGRVTVSYAHEGNELVLRVADTGQGIPEKELERIFEDFYQVDEVRPRGSGIGLALVRAFTELQGGSVSVESRVNVGSTFTVSIPYRECNPEDEIQAVRAPGCAEETSELNSVASPELSTADMPGVGNSNADDNRPLVLVVDDNPDIVTLVSRLLEHDYRVCSAANGLEGLKSATRDLPDLIISDVMMPVMDGYEFCRRVKEEMSTSHIPVLLLTACAMDEQYAQGYDSHADGYMSKPFSAAVLTAQCRSLIANRKRIHELWSNNSSALTELSKRDTSAVPVVEAPDLDKQFYTKFLEVVERRMSESDLNIDAIAAETGLGHSQFYRKIKALTGSTPVELVRRIRLERSRHLLLTTDLSISEIAYRTGFSAGNYFAKCFRDVFEESPTELRARINNGVGKAEGAKQEASEE